MTHLSRHVPSLSVTGVWELPMWSWRQYVSWQDDHLEAYKKAAKKGVHCGNC